ncbi:major facilitator superfamily-domain-containing protein [Poronia punctata]|nr:major facilitator superfamily-domain-containing protein [Poronia punctata]
MTLLGMSTSGGDGANNNDEEAASVSGPKEDCLEKEESSDSPSVAETLSLPREILFVAIVCTAQLFTQSALGQVISIIEVVGEHYHITNPTALAWFIAGYSLTVGTFILFSGRLGDVFGYKTMFLIGMAWFSLWSMVCGLAVYSNHVLFTFARVLQGIGPAIVLPNGLAIFGASYKPGRRKNMVFAIFGATAPGGSILGSLFSALFALAWWPWTFWTLSLVLGVVVVLGYYAIPPCPPADRAERPRGFTDTMRAVDAFGTVLGVTGLVLVNVAWNQAPIVGWEYAYVYVLLILGVLFLAAFFLYEIRYADAPLIDIGSLSSDVSFVLAAVACGWATFGIWFFYTWQFLLTIRHETPLLATAMTAPVAISGAAAAVFTGALLHRLGAPVIMTASLAAFTVGIVLMATCPVDQIYWAQTFVSIVIMPWGMDMSFPASTLILSNSVPRKNQGIAASLVNTVINYSISLGLGFAGTVEVYVNDGGRDVLRGYRGAFYFGIGLSVMGICVCLAYLWRQRRRPGKERAES